MRSEIQLDLGHIIEAMRDAERSIAILVEQTPPEMLTTFSGDAHLALGRALQAQAKREEAQAAFRSAVKYLESALGPGHPDTESTRHVEGAAQSR